MAGSPTAKTHEPFAKRAAEIGYSDWAYADNPVQFWDLFGEQGHPIRTTISEMGPLLLARLMDLNEVQEGRSEEHTSELKSLMRISYAVFCLKKQMKRNEALKYTLRAHTSYQHSLHHISAYKIN